MGAGIMTAATPQVADLIAEVRAAGGRIWRAGDMIELRAPAPLPADRLVAPPLAIRPASPLPNPEAALEAALARPTGTAPLADLAKGKKTACVVVCDITRPVPNRLILPPLLFSGGWATYWVMFRRNLWPILQLAIGLVVVRL